MNELSNLAIEHVLGSNFNEEKKWKRHTFKNVHIWKYEDDYVKSYVAVEKNIEENVNDVGSNSSPGILTFEKKDRIKKEEKRGKIRKCDQCEATYRTSTSLQNHKKTKHEGFRLKCNQCEATFTQSNNLKKHKNKHSNGQGHVDLRKKEQKNGVMDRKYQCDKCEAAYQSFGGLLAHKKSKHEGLRIKCNQCAAAFTQSHNLKQHMKKKHGKTDCEKKEDKDSEEN